jgi:hypothetical protein
MAGSLSAGQNVYRWIDKQGNTVVSDRPPPVGVEYEVVNLQGNMMNQVDNPIPAPLPQTGMNSGDETAQQAQQPGIPKNPQYCSQARQNLSNLNTFARIRIQGADGEYRYLTEEEKEDQRRQAQDAIDAYCE